MGSAVFMIVIVAGFLVLRYFVDYRLFDILLGTICLFATFEMIRAFGTRVSVSHKMTLLVYSAALVPLYVFFGVHSVWILFICFVAVSIALMVFDYKRSSIESVALTIFGGLYPALGILCFTLINHLSEFGLDQNVAHYAVLLTFSIAPAADAMAMLFGSLLKGPKLCPTISPKKTIAGFIGSFVGGVIPVFVFYFIMLPVLPETWVGHPYLFMVILGLAGSALATFGDLVESVIKRNLGIKDMGKILPGHGGVLDRIDSMLFTSVAIFFAFLITTFI